MTHTPGPWEVDEDGEIVTANPISGPRGGKPRIVEVVCFGHDYDDTGSIYNDADAHLIAAAPELLEAAEALAKNRGGDYGKWLNLEAAINKAKGATS